jgi:hypothetical protein
MSLCIQTARRGSQTTGALFFPVGGKIQGYAYVKAYRQFAAEAVRRVGMLG